MSIEETILEAISTPLAKRGGVTVTLLGLPLLQAFKPKTIHNAVLRLQKKQYLTFEGKYIAVSEKGKQYIKTRNARLQVFSSPFTKKEPKNLIVMFDIPEARKAEREWFRFHLKRFGYEMIQKSVWFGPSPLPKEFVIYVKSIGLADTIQTFTVTGTSIGRMR